MVCAGFGRGADLDFEDHVYRLIAPEHVGYGRTVPYPAPLVEHELAIITSLVHRVGEPVHLVGHSYGGALMARTAVRASERVQTLTLIEPTLFYLLAATQRTAAHQEIFDQAHRVSRYVDAGDPEEAARGFIDYWGGVGTYNAMDERVRTPVTAGMAKLRDEWLTAFEASGTTLEALAGLRMPIQLIAGSQTTAAARGIIDVLNSIWPELFSPTLDTRKIWITKTVYRPTILRHIGRSRDVSPGLRCAIPDRRFLNQIGDDIVR